MNLQQSLTRLIAVLASAMLVLATGTVVSLIGIELSGGVTEWRQWLTDNTGVFLIWRLCLYAIALTYWLRIRRTYPLQKSHHHRLLRLECTVIALLVLLELPSFGGPR